MLEFHQFMWTVESELPNNYTFATDGDVDPISVWCDQPNMQGFLGEAWSARRTDDWSFFESQITEQDFYRGDIPMTPVNFLLLHSLNHLIMYSGPGWHPLLSLDQLVDDQPLLGGFTSNFKRTWAPMLPALQTYWRHSRFAPHLYTGTDFERVSAFREKKFWTGGDEVSEYMQNWMDGDNFHLCTHCGAPSGYRQFEMEADPRRFEVTFHQENVVTVTGTDYCGWMKFLRDFDVRDSKTLVKYNIDSPASEVQFTLGHFLLTGGRDYTRASRNRVCFLTDSQLPMTMDDLVGFEISENLN